VSPAISQINLNNGAGSGINAVIDSNCIVGGQFGVFASTGNGTLQITNNNFGDVSLSGM